MDRLEAIKRMIEELPQADPAHLQLLRTMLEELQMLRSKTAESDRLIQAMRRALQ